MHGFVEKTRTEKYPTTSDQKYVCEANLMDEIKLTRVGRYKIAWDRCDDIASRNSKEQGDTEKLRRLAELGKQFKKPKKTGH